MKKFVQIMIQGQGQTIMHNSYNSYKLVCQLVQLRSKLLKISFKKFKKIRYKFFTSTGTQNQFAISIKSLYCEILSFRGGPMFTDFARTSQPRIYILHLLLNQGYKGIFRYFLQSLYNSDIPKMCTNRVRTTQHEF